MAWPEEIDQTVGSTWYLEWQSAAESSFKLRKRDTFRYYALFLVKGVIYCFILYHTIRFLKRKAPRWLGFGPYRRDPNFQKLRRLVCLQIRFSVICRFRSNNSNCYSIWDLQC